MKKALLITTLGGFVSMFEMNDVKLLQELGYEVHYASNFTNRIYEFDEIQLEGAGVILHQVDISKNPYNVKKLIKSIKEVAGIIRREDIQLVHCHTPVGGVIGRVASILSKVRPYVIYTAHGFHFFKGAPILNWMLYYPVEWILAKATDCLITINSEDYNRSRKMGSRHCVKVPGVGIDESRFYMREGMAPELSAEYSNNDRKEVFRIVTVGELNENKNNAVVIQAIGQMTDEDIRYDMYGNGPDREQLEQLIQELRLEKKVHLHSFTTDVAGKLWGADCFVFPSKREGLGMAALEAMACGVPLITADNRGTREYMKDGVNGIVCWKNTPEEYCQAIRKLKEDAVYRKQLATEAGKTVKKFSINENEIIMRRVYENARSESIRHNGRV